MPAESPARPSDPSASARALRRGYGLLLGGFASWFGFWGAQMVMFQWLVVDALGAAPARVGTAQMAVTMPSLLFLLLGGATADRFEPRRLLIAIHLTTALVVTGLWLALATDALSYALLLVYAVVVGTLQAFGFPARDTKLSEVVSGAMSRAVAGTTLTHHSSQMLGALAAGSASWLGSGPVLALQVLALLSGVIPISRLPHRAPRPGARPRLSLHDLRAGVVEVAGSPVLRPVMILAVSSGILFVGPYLVILPLLVRDVYAGGAAEMGILTAMFPLGSMLGGLAIIWRGGIQRNGRALAVGQLGASLFIAIIALGLPFAGTVLAVLGWGLCGSLFINSGRTIFQENASEAHRARVLSVYTLGVMGGAPLGSLLSGFLATPLGLHGALALDAALSLAVTLGVIAMTRLAALR
jgi:MFS family permease